MARPEYPRGCIMPREMISSIRQDQALYDSDPERYEREERYAEERREEERQRDREEEFQMERLQEQER